MTNATWVHFYTNVAPGSYPETFRAIASESATTMCVLSVENGIVTLDLMCGITTSAVSEIVAGLFSDDSNFASELSKALGYDTEIAISGIKFNFNGVPVMVSKENATKERIPELWWSSVEERFGKQYLEEEARKYRSQKAKALRKEFRKNAVQRKIVEVDDSTKLEFKNEYSEGCWNFLLECNADNIRNQFILKFARRLGKYMQHLMHVHNKTVFDIAKQSANLCGVDQLSGVDYNSAIHVLEGCWKYGDELREWHNIDLYSI